MEIRLSSKMGRKQSFIKKARNRKPSSNNPKRQYPRIFIRQFRISRENRTQIQSQFPIPIGQKVHEACLHGGGLGKYQDFS